MNNSRNRINNILCECEDFDHLIEQLLKAHKRLQSSGGKVTLAIYPKEGSSVSAELGHDTIDKIMNVLICEYNTCLGNAQNKINKILEGERKYINNEKVSN